MQCKSLWIKASAKCINVNVNVNICFLSYDNIWFKKQKFKSVNNYYYYYYFFFTLWGKGQSFLIDQLF